MAMGLPGYNVQPVNYIGKDGILFHLQDDMSVFLKLSSTTELRYTSSMQVSQHPVMSGANVADNMARQPKQISISGVVVAGYEGAFFLKMNTTVVEDFITTVETWRDQKQLVRVLAKDGLTLPNAVISEFSATKNKEIANGLNIEMTFIGIDIVRPATKTTVNTGAQRGTNVNGSATGAKSRDGAVQGKKSLGNQATKVTASSDGCDWVRARPDAEVAGNASLGKLQANCKLAQKTFQKASGGSVRTYTGSANADVLKYRAANPVQSTGNNANAQTGKVTQ